MNAPRTLLCWSCWEGRHLDCYGADLCQCEACEELTAIFRLADDLGLI